MLIQQLYNWVTNAFTCYRIRIRMFRNLNFPGSAVENIHLLYLLYIFCFLCKFANIRFRIKPVSDFGKFFLICLNICRFVINFSFLSLPNCMCYHCTPWVRTTGSKNHQRVLQRCPPSPTWCCAAQETRVVVNRQLAPPSRQCSSTFLALDSDFLENSLLPWYAPCDFWQFPKLKGPKVRYFPNNKNPTRALNTCSLKCCLPSTDAIDRQEKLTHVYEGLRLPHVCVLHWNPPSFREKKVGYLSHRVV